MALLAWSSKAPKRRAQPRRQPLPELPEKEAVGRYARAALLTVWLAVLVVSFDDPTSDPNAPRAPLFFEAEVPDREQPDGLKRYCCCSDGVAHAARPRRRGAGCHALCNQKDRYDAGDYYGGLAPNFDDQGVLDPAKCPSLDALGCEAGYTNAQPIKWTIIGPNETARDDTLLRLIRGDARPARPSEQRLVQLRVNCHIGTYTNADSPFGAAAGCTFAVTRSIESGEGPLSHSDEARECAFVKRNRFIFTSNMQENVAYCCASEGEEWLAALTEHCPDGQCTARQFGAPECQR